MRTAATKHFYKRAKQRAGLNKRTVQRFCTKALIHGLQIEDFKDSSLFLKYLNSISKPHYHIIVYNRYIIIYADDNNVAITLLNLPKDFYSTVDRVKKNKKAGLLK